MILLVDVGRRLFLSSALPNRLMFTFPAVYSSSFFVFCLFYVSPLFIFLYWSLASFPSSAFPLRGLGLLWGGIRRGALILFSFFPCCQSPTSSQAGRDAALFIAFILIFLGLVLISFKPSNSRQCRNET
ncbi:hypothetical protein CHARACLAT_013584 [Characodon lateralis]|uniref:Transmembrane protein n=1 Tax=Characodon lateralis TaxID=208331 RepID=A0ABU7DR13_9TELE|nr:hypothetical protein [Characodon lateralis]